MYKQLQGHGFISVRHYFNKKPPRCHDLLTALDQFFKSDPLFILTPTATLNLYLTKITDYAYKAKVICDLLDKSQDAILFVDHIDEVKLWDEFVLANSGISLAQYNTFVGFKQWLKAIKNNVLKLVSRLLNIIKLKLIRRKHKIVSLTGNLPSICAVSWMDDRTINQETLWNKNPYFGDMLQHLAADNTVQIVGNIIDGSPNYKSIVQRGVHENGNLLFIEDFLTINNCLRAYFKTLIIFKFWRKKFSLSGVHYTPIIRDCLLSDYGSGQFFCALMNYHAFINLFKNAPDDMTIIYPFENQPWERALNFAKSHSKKNIITIAYQFFQLPKQLLMHHFSKLQKKYHVMPDVILVSDNASEKLFTQQNISTIPVGSYRYQPLLSQKTVPGQNYFKKAILCCLFLDSTEAIELAQKAIVLSKYLTRELWINFHPLLANETKQVIYSLASNAGHIYLIDKPISQLLPDVSLVLYQSSSVCYEAALQGVPSVFVESDLGPDLNRFSSDVKSFSDPKEGQVVVLELLSNQMLYVKYSQELYDKARRNLIKANKGVLKRICK